MFEASDIRAATTESVLDALLFRQDGVATREQLMAAGLSAGEIRAFVEGRRWRDLNEHVVITHNGPLSGAQAHWAVYLSAQSHAGIAGLSAQQLSGVTGFDTPVVHIVVTRGSRVLAVDGVKVKVHESRRLAAEDVLDLRSPPVTGLARSTVDAAAWTDNVGLACRIFVAPIQQRLLQAPELREALLRAGRVRHRRTLTALVNDLCGGAEALSEVEFLRFCRRHGLPTPKCQVRLDSQGRRRYLDAVFVLPDGRVVRVEIDGGVHLTLSARWADTAKDNDALLDNRAILRFPSVAIYTDDIRAVRQLRRAVDLDPPQLVSA